MIQDEGIGWRLARDTSRSKFPILIGGAGWSFELTSEEWCELVNILSELSNQQKHLHNQLMQEELLRLEIERQSWWVCIDGDKDSWSLHIILQAENSGARAIEANWPPPAAQQITEAMRTMWDKHE